MEHERVATVDDIVSCLRDAISVNLVGLRQSGRSRVARRVVGRLEGLGAHVVSLSGIAALRDRPLVALALAGVDVPAGSAASSGSGAAAALSGLLEPDRSVLVVDDADDLDAVSCGVVVAARARRPFPVLAVTRPVGRRSGNPLTARLQPGVRVALDPLDFDGLHRVLHRMFPGHLASSTIARIATLSGGLPGLVEAIVSTGRRSGAIVEDCGVWRVDGSLWDARLAQAVEPLVADLDDEEMDALTTLARAGTVAVARAREIVPEQVLARIDKMGLLQVAETPSGLLVGVFPPLVAEHLRRTGVSQTVTPDGTDRGTDPSATLLTPRLALASSRAAILNVRIIEHWTAEVDALRAVWNADPGPENAVPLLWALNESAARPTEFAGVVDGTRREGGDPLARILFVEWQAALATLVLGDVDGGREILDAQRAVLPAFTSKLRATEAYLRLMVGPKPDSDLLLPAGADEERSGAECMELVRIATLLAEGRTVDALAALPGNTPTHAPYVETHRVCVGLARVLHGDFDDGVEWALRAMADAETTLRLGEIHAHAYVAALGLAFAGRLDELDALLGSVLTLSGTTILSEPYQIGVLGLASLAAGWRGRLDYGWSLAVQAETTGRRSGPFPGMLHGVTPMFGSDMDYAVVGERLWGAVDELLVKGYVAASIAAAVTAAEVVPDAERAAAAVDQARRTQSPFLVALGDYVAATVAGDPEALAACAADLRGRGARLHALKASVTRALVLRAHGEIDASVRQAERAWVRASELGQEFRGLFYRLGYAVGLSAREREIALMMANGMTGQKAASALGLSTRTVDNYLVGAYRKLGCEGRDDLVRAVTTWAALG